MVVVEIWIEHEGLGHARRTARAAPAGSRRSRHSPVHVHRQAGTCAPARRTPAWRLFQVRRVSGSRPHLSSVSRPAAVRLGDSSPARRRTHRHRHRHPTHAWIARRLGLKRAGRARARWKPSVEQRGANGRRHCPTGSREHPHPDAEDDHHQLAHGNLDRQVGSPNTTAPRADY